MTVELDVNLLSPPNKRWQLPETLRDQARQLLKMYYGLGLLARHFTHFLL